MQEQLTYYYDSVYKDRLVKVNGQSISGYDLLGRPTNYLGTSLTWENGRVSKFVKNGKTTTCKYNADGIRTEKTYSGIIHKYYLEDNTIVRESVSGNDDYEMLFMYGQNGIVGFTCNNINYYYRKNLLGDIVAIYNESGTKLCEYAYDAWGNCTILFDTNGIGALNPFRYRSYYWDSELGLYYLNARYYDPAICRFISQDSIKYLEPETLNGLNLFAYCLNNPVMETDPNGTFGHIIASVVAGALVGIAGRIVADFLAGKWSSWQSYVGAAVGGAISGALISTFNVSGIVGATKAFLVVGTSIASSLAADATTLSLNIVTNQETRSPEQIVSDIVENALWAGAVAAANGVISGDFAPQNTTPKLLTPVQEITKYSAQIFFSELGKTIKEGLKDVCWDGIWSGIQKLIEILML